MIKGILINPSGVLYRREEPTIHYALRLAKAQGSGREPTAEEEARLEVLKEQAADGWITPQNYWDEYLKMCGVADAAKRAQLVEKILEQVNHVIGSPGAHETMKALKERGFTLGIVTSTMYPLEWKMSWLETAGVAKFIDVVASSMTLRAHKPHPSVYWVALNQAGLTPRQAACVAPNNKELDGARRVGMVTVAVLYEPDTKADYYAETLPDLLALPIFQR